MLTQKLSGPRPCLSPPAQTVLGLGKFVSGFREIVLLKLHLERSFGQNNVWFFDWPLKINNAQLFIELKFGEAIFSQASLKN